MSRYDHTAAKHLYSEGGGLGSDWYAFVTRDGERVWMIQARNHIEARDLGNWLDKHKPGWAEPGAYEAEL